MNSDEIVKVREYYWIPDFVTDEQINKELDGSFGLFVIRLEKAKKDFSKAIARQIPESLKKASNRLFRKRS